MRPVIVALVLAVALGTLGLAGPVPWLLAVPLAASVLAARALPREAAAEGYR